MYSNLFSRKTARKQRVMATEKKNVWKKANNPRMKVFVSNRI